jgi:hypothetical protein
MNFFVCLITNLPVDAGAVRDGIAPGKSFPQDRGVGKIGRHECKTLIADQTRVSAINSSRYQNR